MRLRMVELKDMAVREGTKESWTREAYDEGFFFGFLSCAGLTIGIFVLIRLGGWVFGCF